MRIAEKTEGAWDSALLAQWSAALAGVPGDYAEIGVYKGQSFAHLARLAAGSARMAHAFDSFRGMGRPGPRDGTAYPAGHFSVGGVCAFRARMDRAGLQRWFYRAHAGYVPACFGRCSGIRLALAIVDLDHYEPTRLAIAWAWDRLSPGGLLCLDDWFPGRESLASGAIGEWLAAGAPTVYWQAGPQIVLRR